ncbi:MAG: hypothetical protein ACI9TB_001257 [Parasphingorhabdus sp.]|jgi:hypothetical protein|tara:strand:+ start:672 stop:884 length:213 start_codon:yes stop_codon:yes gene_type:complete
MQFVKLSKRSFGTSFAKSTIRKIDDPSRDCACANDEADHQQSSINLRDLTFQPFIGIPNKSHRQQKYNTS